MNINRIFIMISKELYKSTKQYFSRKRKILWKWNTVKKQEKMKNNHQKMKMIFNIRMQTKWIPKGQKSRNRTRTKLREFKTLTEYQFQMEINNWMSLDQIHLKDIHQSHRKIAKLQKRRKKENLCPI